MEEVNKEQTKETVIQELEVLVKSEDVLAVRNEVKALYKAFYTLTDEEKKAQLAAFQVKERTEDEDIEVARFEFEPNSLDNRFVELKNIFSDKLTAAKEQKKQQEKENLTSKKDLLAQLQTLVENEMKNPGAAFTAFYEIRDKWDETGDVNKANFKELQYEYSHLRELFYYNVGIFNELKTYDFKINGENKIAIIGELKQLLEQDSIKVMERGVKELQGKWDEIGPTTNEQWETLKDGYWGTVNGIYEKIKVHYQAIRDKQAAAIENKQNIVGEMDALFQELANYKSPQQWSAVSTIVNELHKKWKKEDFAGKDKEDKLWENFSQLTEEVRKKNKHLF